MADFFSTLTAPFDALPGENNGTPGGANPSGGGGGGSIYQAGSHAFASNLQSSDSHARNLDAAQGGDGRYPVLSTIAAEATLTADTIAGLLPSSDYATIINAHVPMAFISNNTVALGGGIDGSFNYPLNPDTGVQAVSTKEIDAMGMRASAGDWGIVTATVATYGAALYRGGFNVPAIIQSTSGAISVGLVSVASPNGPVATAFANVGHDLTVGYTIATQNPGLFGTP